MAEKQFWLIESTPLKNLLEDGSQNGSQGDKAVLPFTDDVLEVAEVFGAFLSLVYNIPLEKPQGKIFDPLVGLLRKYEADSAIHCFRLELRASFTMRTFNIFDVFRGCAHLGDEAGCAMAIEKGWHLRFAEEKDAGVNGWDEAETTENLDDERCLDAACWGEYLIRTMPPRVTVALLRACYGSSSKPDNRKPKEIAQSFSHYYA